jgi:hypothetical protein
MIQNMIRDVQVGGFEDISLSLMMNLGMDEMSGSYTMRPGRIAQGL